MADKFIARGSFKQVFEQLDAYTDKIPLENAKSYVSAILEIGDKLEPERESIGFISDVTDAYRLVVSYLRRFKIIERGGILLECFENSNSFSVVEYILQSDENIRNGRHGDIFLVENNFELLKKMFVVKLNDLSIKDPNFLLNHSNLLSFLYRWKKWGDEVLVESWLQKNIESDNGLISILKAFVVTGLISSGTNNVTITKKIRTEDVERFFDVETINERVLGLDSKLLKEKELEAYNAYLDVVEYTTGDVKGKGNDSLF